jgi:branched-chain amino acid transport system permease protein
MSMDGEDRVAMAARYLWEPAVLVSALLALTAVITMIGDGSATYALTSGLISCVMVVGLYIFVGNTGILSFSHSAYAMIGAYAAAWLTMSPMKKSIELALPPILADHAYPGFPSAIAAAALAGVVALVTGFPLTRLNGISASLGTLAVLVIFNTIYSNWDTWTFGSSSLLGVPVYVDQWIALAGAAFTLLAAAIYQKSRFGLAARASRENAIAARASGVDVGRTRVMAFALSGFFMGLGGVLQAHFLGSIAVSGFGLSATFMTLAMLVIGGQESLTGAVVGVVAVSALLEILRQGERGWQIGAWFVQLPLGTRELGIAFLMLIILIVRNAGLTGGRDVPWPFPRAARTPRARAAAMIVTCDPNAPRLTLEASGVSVKFDGLAAIDHVTLTTTQREIFGLIGPNGAGKTTLVNVLTGFQQPTAGSVRLGGVDMMGRGPHEFARLGIARTFQAVRLFRNLTVVENIEAAAVGAGLERREAAERALEILDWMRMGGLAESVAGALPYADERRVGIARALALAPRFALLDEPAAGMSDVECDGLMELIADIPARFNCGVLLIEHNMRVVMGVCHRIQVIDSGRTVAEGAPLDVRRDPGVIRAYLGSKSERAFA